MRPHDPNLLVGLETADDAVPAEADREGRAAAPFMAYGDFTGQAPSDVCAMWLCASL